MASVHELIDRTAEARDDDHWIGQKPSLAEMIAFLTIGTIGLIIAGVQPVLLGALVTEHRLSAASLGWTTTVEFLTIGLGVSVSGMLFKPTGLRVKATLAAVLALVANLAVHGQSGVMLIIDRAAAGLFEGGLIWITQLMITRSATPTRWAAIYLVIQAVAQLLFAATIPGLLMTRFGADGGFYGLALTCLPAMAAAWLLPNRLAALTGGGVETAPGAGSPSGPPSGPLSGPALTSLAGVALIFAYFIGLFAYLGQLGAQAHLSAPQAGYAVAMAVGASILGSAAAAAAAKRISYFLAFLICIPTNILAIVLLAALPQFAVFMAACGVFGFFWGFFMPFQVPFVIEADPSRRAALLIPGIQSVGAAAGPLLCSFFVTDAEARGALVVCSACFAAAFGIAVILHGLKIARNRRI